MLRITLAALLCLASLGFWPGWAVAGVTGAKVVFLGELGKDSALPGRPQADIPGGPGIRFGMEMIPEGSPQGAPVVLEARLKRPGDSEDALPVRWLIAARIGIPVLSDWEFAYDWEVEPGVWTMTVSHEDAVLVTASFMVVRPAPLAAPGPAAAVPERPSGTQAAPQTAPKGGKPGEVRQDKKTPEPAPAPAARPPAPSAPGSTQGLPAPKAVGGAPDKRVLALIGGVYSEEARALWVAAFLKGRGVTACVRAEERGGKKRWSLVAGWRDTREEARRAKEELTPLVGEIVIIPMNAAELQKGMQCR